MAPFSAPNIGMFVESAVNETGLFEFHMIFYTRIACQTFATKKTNWSLLGLSNLISCFTDNAAQEIRNLK